MSHYGGKNKGERPKHRAKLRTTQLGKGRGWGASKKRQARTDVRDRILRVEKEWGYPKDLQEAEPHYKIMANSIAQANNAVFNPTEIRNIHRLGELNDAEYVENIGKSYGEVSDFLPLQHLVKVLSRQVEDPLIEGDRHVYLLDSTEETGSLGHETRNERALEYMLLTFAGRIPKGKKFDARINNKRFQLDQNNLDGYFPIGDEAVLNLRKAIVARVGEQSSYGLARIKSGDHSVGTRLEVLTQQFSIPRTTGTGNYRRTFSYMQLTR